MLFKIFFTFMHKDKKYFTTYNNNIMSFKSKKMFLRLYDIYKLEFPSRKNASRVRDLRFFGIDR